MEHGEGGHSADERKVPDTDNDGDVVFNASGLLQPGRGAIVSGMLSLSVGRTVTFNNSVAMYKPTDWSPSVYREARKGPWMQQAVDKCRFRQRIEQIELALGTILSDKHRDKVKRCLLFYENREKVKRRLVF
jgi:hypothetical protein